ncbi:MAG: HDIG domain-containing metalloprotein [Desulfovibrio sp.]|uniref:HDIG domain-containing metalloprotein n=1 Tax=Desulfovibrio sp. 7SRBS1 TaxID=3378064 RepID=UPI003B3F37D5
MQQSHNETYQSSQARYGEAKATEAPCPFDSTPDPSWHVPDDEECLALWDHYAMPEHIRKHSSAVAYVAKVMAQRAQELGHPVDVQLTHASGLLHDIAKIYTIGHGGSHAQIGAAWAMEATGNPILGQAVAHHVYWPFKLDAERHFIPLSVIYADKRVMHHKIVSVGKRFTDLLERYGKTDELKAKIKINLEQTLALQDCLSRYLEVNLNAYSFDSGRLV